MGKGNKNLFRHKTQTKIKIFYCHKRVHKRVLTLLDKYALCVQTNVTFPMTLDEILIVIDGI